MEDATAAKRQKRSVDPAADSVDLTLSDNEPDVVEVKEDEPNPGSDEAKKSPSPVPPSLPLAKRPASPLVWRRDRSRSPPVQMMNIRHGRWYGRNNFGPLELAQEARLCKDLYQKMAERYKQTDSVGRAASVIITMADLKRVEDDWLNDELVNFVMEWWRNLIMAGGGPHKVRASPVSSPKCWFASTFFYRLLTVDGETEGYYYDTVARWTKDVDLFENYDVMLIPINEGNTHWFLAVIDFKKKRTEIYDSMLGSRTRMDVHTTLRRYLRDEHLAKRGSDLSIVGWTTHTNELCSVPQQDNCQDCGVFTWLYAAYRSMQCEFKFAQRDMSLLREFITHIVYQSGLEELKLRPV
jgi:sentrin-specific protease 1